MKSTDTPLVFVHGVGLDHTMWLPVMSALPHRRSVTYDMIGHGRAAKPAGPYTLGTFVDQLSDIVRALDCDIDLIGFSMGALVAQGLRQTNGAYFDTLHIEGANAGAVRMAASKAKIILRMACSVRLR